jgi:hypothetical protein
MHKKSSIYDDKVHQAVWDMHPSKAKDDYTCASCHTPHAKTEEEQREGISCSSCHTIKAVEHHSSVNKNVYGDDAKTFYSAEKGRENEKVVYKQESSFFGLNKTTVGSPYHDIDYTNENFYTGESCMGCHSHRENSHGLAVCNTGTQGAKDTKQNCITCHMPKIKGTATTIRLSETHAYHGFAGAHQKPEMLAEYVTFKVNKSSRGFDVSIANKAPHDLMLHPLRVVQLRVNLIREGKAQALATETFVKVIGRDGKPAMPWVANAVLKDSMIKANETRVVTYDTMLHQGDRVEVQLGYYVVNPKALKKLNLEGDKALEKFTILKDQYFTIE